MNAISYALMSFIFLIIISIVYFSKERISTFENKMFSKILLFTICGFILNFICYYLLVADFYNRNIFLYTIFNKLMVCYHVAWVCLFVGYVMILATEEKNNIFKTIRNNRIILYGIDIIVSLIPLFIPMSFEYQNGIYIIQSFSTYYTFIITGLCIFIMILFLVLDYKNFNKKQYLPLYALMVLGIFVSVIQMVYPQLMLTFPMESVICAIMYFTIESPDLKMIKELEIAREQADKANRAKTDFLSSMSHEIRTPLNAIVGFSDCIMDAETLGEAKENAKDIVNASQTLLEIVNGILDISKIEAGKIEIVNSKYNARETFLDLAKLITPKMNEKGLDFTYSIAPDIPETLYGDHANVKKVVTNILSNASKYTDKGFVRYEVNCVNTNDVCKLIISVEDSGRGIKKENVDKMFTKFQRLDEDKNTTIEGTGLGLAITKQLTELMGGKIILHTIYGEGSKFTIMLNQKIEKADDIKQKKYKTTLDLTDVKIMLVDDTPLNLKVAGKLLQRYNANYVVTCDSGFECIERIQRGEKYDLILLDDMMPKMSGVETLKKLKQIEGFNIPTVALTANAITGMREHYLASGFDDYLAKPIEKEQLVQVVNQVLGRSITEEIEVPLLDNTPQIRDEVLPVEEVTVDKFRSAPIEVETLEEDNTINSSTEEILDVQPIEFVNNANDESIVASTDISNEEVSTKVDRNYLESHGVDVNHALELLGDMDMYNATINDFMSEVEDKWNRIVTSKNNNDMENYAIEVHSLKSDCKYLGFMTLADISYQHELKSKEKDIEFVNSNFELLESEYLKVLDIAKEYVKYNPTSE